MASATEWVEGARLRTLPAAVAPVLAGTGAAAAVGGAVWWKALLCLVVALGLQVGVNYANDYSDGIRGTDADRVGPLRLVGSGAAQAPVVRAAAFGCFGVAAVAGTVLALTSGWWLLLVGASAIAAAWFYTGGSRPYGYRGYGELGVFVFFGLVAVLGTTYVQAGRLTWAALAGAVGVGAYACAILVANNIRDIPSDRSTGKRTLAVLLGDLASRRLYVALVLGAQGLGVALVPWHPWAALSLLALVPALPATRVMLAGTRGPALIPVLRDTGRAELVYAGLLGLALVISGAGG